MRIHTIVVYNFDELSSTIQENVLANHWDINVRYDWWESVYEDAEMIGMSIIEFDIDRGNLLKARCTEYPLEICRLIMENHGKDTETYQLAVTYLENRKKLEKDEYFRLCQVDADRLCECFGYIEGVFGIEQDCFDDDVFDDLDRDFYHDIEQCYLSMLGREYNYLTSEDAIKETIMANGYEFTWEGKRI